MALHPAWLGRVTIARRLASGAWREASVPVSDLPYAVRQFQGEHDVYLTQNRFFSRRRLVAHLAELNAQVASLWRTLLPGRIGLRPQERKEVVDQQPPGPNS
jgi:hypothetical protein